MNASRIWLITIGAVILIGGVHPVFAEPALQRRSLELELEQVEGSSAYEVEVYKFLEGNKKGEAKTFHLKSNVWKATLNPGHYEMRVRSIDDRGVPGEWAPSHDFMVPLFPPHTKEPADKAALSSSNDDFEKVKFEWGPGERATKYILTVKDANSKVVATETTASTNLTLKLQVAQEYTWQVASTDDLKTEGEQSPPTSFTVIGKKLDSPSINKIPELDTRVINWGPIPFAENYETLLEVKNAEDSWAQVDKQTTSKPELIFHPALATGTYRVKVIATAKNRVSSDPSEKEFETTSSANDDLRRASYQFNSLFFAKVGLGFSYISYKNNNLDSDTNTQVQVLGAAQSLTLGSWFGKRSSWGALLNYESQSNDMSMTNAYKSYSLLAIKRINLDQIRQLRLHLGLKTDQMPDSHADIYGNVTTGKVTSYGPTLRLSYLRGFTSKLGLEVTGQMFIPLTGNSPTGASVKTKPNFLIEIGVNRRLTKNIIGSVAYRYSDLEAGYYHPSDFTFPYLGNGQNTISLTSHSLIFSLQFGF